MSGCSNDAIEYQDSQREEYIKNFIQEFGIPAPGHTYNVSQKVGVTLDVADPKISSVRIFTAFPGNKDCRLIARRSVSAHEFDIDIFNSNDYVYVEFLDGNDEVISGKYVNLSGDRLTIKDDRAASRAMGIAERGKENLVGESMNTWPTVGANTLGFKEGDPIKNALVGDLRLLSGNFDEVSDHDITVGDIWSLVGKGAVFEESAVIDNKCILTRYADAFKVKDGVSYTTQSETDVVINYIYGCTMKWDALGYFYYKKGADEAEIAAATKYVLIEDARPEKNISYKGGEDLSVPINQNVYSGQLSSEFQAEFGEFVTTHKFRLTYFDEYGKAHEKFPKDYTIAFFGVISAGSEDGGVNYNNWSGLFRFSLPWMNELIKDINHGGCSATQCEYTTKHPAYNFISYMWGDKVLMGFEDEVDDDFNDIMFYVEGDIDKSKLTRITDDGNHLKPQGCLLAVEDLGATDDWDFNDLVVGVAVEDKDDNTKIVTVDPLAAGGTLPIHLMYTDKEGNNFFVGPEFHKWFDVSTSTMHNTGAQAVQPATCVKFEVPSTFSMSPDTKEGSNMGGFWVLVDKEGEYADANNAYALEEASSTLNGTSILPPTSVDKGESTVPYMLCLGEDWHWPRERKNINAAYDGGFASWVSDPTANWYASGHTNYVIMDLITLKPGESASSVISPKQ